MKCFVIVREESPGQFSASPAGIPELKETAASRADAANLDNAPIFPKRRWGVDPNDPLQIEYMEDIERYRREDRERTIREIEELERLEAEQQEAG